jgi:YD repeat-containing protein
MTDVVIATLSRFSTIDATTNRTSLYKDRAGSTLGAASYQIATTSGVHSDTYTGSASQDWSMIIASFRPATSTTAATVSTTTYSYDQSGNLTTAGSNTFTYNYKNQMTASTVSGTSTTYSYDPDGTRSIAGEEAGNWVIGVRYLFLL